MNRFVEFLKDLAWPRTCEVCGAHVDRPGSYLCSDCVMRLPFVPTDGLCRKCGRDAAGLDGEFLCEDCRMHRPAFDRCVSAFRFEGEARELVNAFKFRDRLYLRNDLVDFLEAAVRVRFKIPELACVVPMPSTRLHRFWRGYNQCAYLAELLAKRIGKPCVPLLCRIGAPRRQGGLTEADRRQNVLGTFAVRPRALLRLDAVHATVLLVDDIMTTGSTLAEAARTLKDAGVARVWCASLAKSIRL